MTQNLPTLIIGSGPAGYTAAIYLARSGVVPHVWSGVQKGGQLTITTDVENYPGFTEPIMGPALMQAMEEQACKLGCVISTKTAIEVNLSERPFKILDDSNEVTTAESIIIATGATARWLGCEGETRLRGRGVSACATCDGFFFKGLTVAVIGGGNTAAEEALFLTNHAEKVYVIHRRNTLRAEKILRKRVLHHPKIEILWNRKVVRIIGEKEVTSVRLEDVENGREEELALNGVFVAIGHDPATSLFQGQIAMDKNGYIERKALSSHTSREGVFVAGDASDKVYRQAITAAGMGCIAAIDAFHFLERQ